MKELVYKIEVFGKSEIGEYDSLEFESNEKIEKEILNKFICNACVELGNKGYGKTGFVVKESKIYKII